MRAPDLNLNRLNKLQRDILDGVYAPGEKLSMSKLKKDLNVGQSPIREALSRLVAKGLVVLEEHKGFRVASISEKDICDLFRTVVEIDNVAIRQSIDLGGDEWEVNLVATFHQLALIETKKDSIDCFFWSQCFYSFHRALISGCNSSYLIDIHNDLFLKLERYMKLALEFDLNLVKNWYKRGKLLLEAALKHDSEETCRILNDIFNDILKVIILSFKTRKLF